jgi:hypothetical protein
MTESKFKCRVVAYLKRELPGAWVYHPTDRWVSGIPDLLILYEGIFAAIELKVGKNQATKLQLIVLQRIGAAGGITAICRDMSDIKKMVQKIGRM